MNIDLFFVFDVESIGLYGDSFAVGGGLYGKEGDVMDEFCYCIDKKGLSGMQSDIDWVQKNVPEMEITHLSGEEMRNDFWKKMVEAKSKGAAIFAECKFPVETNFVAKCIEEDKSRIEDAPYPFHEIASVMISAGVDPLKSYKRIEGETPAHHPLMDSRQSFRLLRHCIRKLRKGQ
jgi:hypothetical protein